MHLKCRERAFHVDFTPIVAIYMRQAYLVVFYNYLPAPVGLHSKCNYVAIHYTVGLFALPGKSRTNHALRPYLKYKHIGYN